MSSAANAPLMQVVWTDSVTGKNGFMVIHNLTGSNLCTGGTRMRAGCTMTEVEDLARGMAYKAATYGLPVGGAKGGIDCDPKDPDAYGVLYRFIGAMRPWLDSRWVTAEDLGVTQQLIDDIFEKQELGQSFHAAIQRSANPEATLKRVHSGLSALTAEGHQVGDLAGGYGVAQSCLGIVEAKNWNPTETTVAIQGVGTMGGGAAQYLHQAGLKITAVADALGVLENPEGLDIPALLALRNTYGEIERDKITDPAVTSLDRDAILSREVDILIPAATSYAITTFNANQVTAKFVVEAANAATTADAELMLANAGTVVIPDFVANAGAVVWAWWLLLGLIDDNAEATLAKLQSEIKSKVIQLITPWENSRILPRVTATYIADTTVSSNSGNDTVVIP